MTIGADLPLSGDDAVDGLPVRDAITLAITKAGSVCGVSSHADACLTVKPLLLDDVSEGIHDPAKGAKNVQQLAGDPSVLGVIGPLYDSVARSEMPIANAGGLSLISPSTTDPCLTQEPAGNLCQGLAARLRPRGPNTYFRVLATALSQAPAAADAAYHTLGKRHAFIVDGQTSIAHLLASAFAARFTHDGGTITDAGGADLVYFAGADIGAAASLRGQMAAANPGIVVVGTDALGSDQFARAVGLTVRNSYYTAVGPYPPATRTAADFVKAYRGAYGRDPGVSALAAYDATGVLLSAISRAIDDAGGAPPTRAQVLSELSHTSGYSGAMGRFGFDSGGDTTLRWVSLYEWLAPTDRFGHFTAELAE